MKTYFRIPLTLSILLSLFTISCSKSSNKEKTKVLHISFAQDANILDPRRGGDPVASTVHFMLFEGLVRMTEASTHELALADKIDISDDGLEYTFHLRKTFWNDGYPVTAHDFLFAWSSMLAPDFPCPNAHLLYPIKNGFAVKMGNLPLSELGLSAPDDHTFIVTLEKPTAYFLDLISFCVFFPVPSHIARDHPEWADKTGPLFISNGPFLLKEWSPCNYYRFSKNPSYWKKEEVHLDGIEAVIVNGLLGTKMFVQGELDFFGTAINKLLPDWLGTFQKEKLLYKQPLGATTFISFNLSHPLLQNKNIRKALSLSISKESLVQNITQGEEQVAFSAIPPLLKKGVTLKILDDQNIMEAKKALDQGLKELGALPSLMNDLSLSYFTDPTYRSIAQAIQQIWRETLGIEVQLDEKDFKIFQDALYKKNYQMGITYWAVQYNDQMNILDRFKLRSNSKNYPGYENPEFISLLDASFFAKTEEERATILEEAETVLTEDLPFFPLYHWNTLFVKHPYVQGLFISPIGSIHFNRVSLEKEGN